MAALVDAAVAGRRAAGHTPECHGDLHRPTSCEWTASIAAFDCIEFDAGLPLHRRGRGHGLHADGSRRARGLPALAARFINAWLERTGEYEGVPGLRLCLVYRALVRAMAEHLRGAADAAGLRGHRPSRGRPPRRRASPSPTACPARARPALAALAGSAGGLRIRSDVERKRLFGLDALADSRGRGLDIYTGTRRSAPTSGCSRWPASRCGPAGRWCWTPPSCAGRARRGAARWPTHWACPSPSSTARRRWTCCATPAARRGDASEADAAVLEKLRAVAQPLHGPERLRERGMKRRTAGPPVLRGACSAPGFCLAGLAWPSGPWRPRCLRSCAWPWRRPSRPWRPSWRRSFGGLSPPGWSALAALAPSALRAALAAAFSSLVAAADGAARSSPGTSFWA